MCTEQWYRWADAFSGLVQDGTFVHYAIYSYETHFLYLQILERADWFMQQCRHSLPQQTTHWKQACNLAKLEELINAWPHMILKSCSTEDGVLIRYGITHCESLRQRLYQRFQEMYATYQFEN